MSKEKRCAVYTRKSTDEGLDQSFNSLDAQRMAAENYIASQKHEGWVCLPEHYDDGGFTGGNMERPALKKLLEDVAAGKVDIIVVYKVDRLSRSLMDFSRIIEILDKSNASFVSVTQHFNTTDSMGRLTLNILLSFAQFEREIISERTRDKMSMQRKLGKFTGGRPILGYDTVPEGGAITVNREEAEIVRQIFTLYLEQQSVLETVRIVRQNGWTNKRWISRDGKMTGGGEFSTSTIHYLLTNKTYIGVIEFNGGTYSGQHEAIIDVELFNRVQNSLAGNRGNLRKPVRTPDGAILSTKLKCAHCNTTMFHTYTARNGKKYSYYVCSAARANGWNTCPHPSISGKEVEEFVLGQISVMMSDREFLAEIGAAAREKNRQQLDGMRAREEILRKQHVEQSEILSNSISKLTVPELANIQDDLAKLETELRLLRQEITEKRQSEINQECIEWYCRDFTRLWEKINRVEQVKVIDLMIESLIFDAAKGTIKINYRDHGVNAVYDYVTYDKER